ncbi:grpE protein homolog 1, mitochondrial-like [Oscarella lobularis]|uniref:grpE protein homolog 1, mitochondrial-like n=1 Tax=Oscarella lobularis TaxID=121494 RepID=UPI0033142571
MRRIGGDLLRQFRHGNGCLVRFSSSVEQSLSTATNKGPPGGSADEADATKANTESKDDAKLSKLTEQLKEVENKYLRSLADAENMRKRFRDQIADAKSYGIQNFAKDLLDVADTLEKASKTIESNEEVAQNERLRSLFHGVEMTADLLQTTFSRHGLVRTTPEGEKFDPNLHEAVFYQEFAGKTPGTIAVVMKPGYLLHGRPVRAAQVGVVKGGTV